MDGRWVALVGVGLGLMGCGWWRGHDGPPADGDAVAFVGALVFDGEAFLPDQTVVVEAGLVSALGPTSAVEAPPGARVIDGLGMTLLPGFIDTHVHLGFFSPADALSGGLTTVRDLAWPAEAIFPLAASLAADVTLGPRLLPAGPMLTPPGGYPTNALWAPPGTGLEVASSAEATQAVASLAEAGARVIKIAQAPAGGVALSPEILLAITTEAHRRDLKVTSHCTTAAQITLALDAGVDELAHGLWSSDEIPDATLDRMVAAGMVVVPTLRVSHSEGRMSNVRRFVARGGRLVYGTDMGNGGTRPAIDGEELTLMVEAGLSVEGALASATSLAAAQVGLPDRGRVEVGAPADLILVNGDPRADLYTLQTPAWVLRDGVIVAGD